MKIACSTSFQKGDLPTALSRISALGFEYVDLIVIGGWQHIMPQDLVADFDRQAAQIEALLQKNKLSAISMNVGVTPHLHDRSQAEANAGRIEQARAICRLMNRLGVKAAGYYPGYRAEGRDWEEALADTIQSMRELSAVAQEHGVRLGPELHWATPVEKVSQCLRLLADYPELTVQYDPSHFILQGEPIEATLPFLKRAHHLHFRGCAPDRMQCPLAEGCSHFGWVLQQAKAIGYSGNASIEYLPNGGFDPETEIRATKALLESLLGS